ncbi:hypothetical protein [Micromonospora aurantiaca]|uniref:Uncharacterized protein n=1 Tax=Micromonospora aurantiaca (nom. illeg.) TaxID=47850 RepID=A0A6N3JU89_9ACTN|nr:hypothetical protein [Micromonospora aurantiaca]AXH89378.1 hypothetical protein DVH21_05195 [Micromonospora aurantiaca]
MCAINGTCGCKGGGVGTFLAALTWQALLLLLKATATALQLALVALIVAGKWGGPRVWRLARRGYRSARHRWVTRPVVLDRAPAGELPQQPTGMTLADLRIKEPANR